VQATGKTVPNALLTYKSAAQQFFKLHEAVVSGGKGVYSAYTPDWMWQVRYNGTTAGAAGTRPRDEIALE